mmetsp:Transcript_17160/g.51154  ORF Transcript_17160/g.51154 Transcript_17160/m.51154 type:complete len:210 (-) Transcript_17160:68-697(-)
MPPTSTNARSSGDSVDRPTRTMWFLEPHSYVSARMPPWNVSMNWNKCRRKSSLTARAVCVVMHRSGLWRYGKSRFGSMWFSSRLCQRKPWALVIGAIQMLRPSTRRRMSSSPAKYPRQSSPASSVTTKGPMISSPCSAPEKNSSGVVGVSAERLVSRTTSVLHVPSLPHDAQFLSAAGKMSGNSSWAIQVSTMPGHSRFKSSKYWRVSP